MNDYRNVGIAAARETGELLMELLNQPHAYKMKNERDIQLDADLKAENLIKAKIKSAFPTHAILAEESGDELSNSEFRWVIDPLDGTINYARGIEEYAVSIALCKNDQPILGVVYQPALHKMFVAERNEGAYLNDKRLTVASEPELINCLAATDNTSNLEARRHNLEMLVKVASAVRHVRIFGSSSLHLARLAEGQIDFYFKTKFNYWDVAAGALIVEEAGGVTSDFQGQSLAPTSKAILVASKAIYHKALELVT